jgi:hypothetical protein
MSRLYYPPDAKPQPVQTVQSLSPDALKTAVAGNAEATPATPDAARADANEFTQKIVKMVPSELVTAYTAGIAVISDVANEETRMIAYGVTFLVCLVLTPIYLNQQAEPGMPKWTHIVISTLAFPVWAYLVSGNVIVPQYYDGSIALLATILFSVVTGAIPIRK